MPRPAPLLSLVPLVWLMLMVVAPLAPVAGQPVPGQPVPGPPAARTPAPRSPAQQALTEHRRDTLIVAYAEACGLVPAAEAREMQARLLADPTRNAAAGAAAMQATQAEMLRRAKEEPSSACASYRHLYTMVRQRMATALPPGRTAPGDTGWLPGPPAPPAP